MSNRGSGRLSVQFCAGLLCLALAGCKDSLLADLSERQANEAISVLQRHRVDAQKQSLGKKRYAVSVSGSQFAQAADLVSLYHLPAPEEVPISSLFPPDALVNSPVAERARLISGLEERLAQTINRVGDVFGARVHASYPIVSRDGAPDRPMHLAVMLNYEGDMTDPILVEQLKQLVKNSFEDLSYDNISVVVFRGHRAVLAVEPPSSTPWGLIAALLAGVAALGAGAIAAAFAWRRRRVAVAENTGDAGKVASI